MNWEVDRDTYRGIEWDYVVTPVDGECVVLAEVFFPGVQRKQSALTQHSKRTF